MMANWIYLSHILSEETPVYGGRAGLRVHVASSIRIGAGANSLQLQFPNHIGTHVDVPLHFFEEGKSVDQYGAADWHFRNTLCISCPKQPGELVTATEVKQALTELAEEERSKVEAVLLKTAFEKRRGTRVYWEDNPGVDPEIGPLLREEYPNVRLLGMDIISVSRWQNREVGRLAHKTLLDPKQKGEPLILVEDMSLQGVEGKWLHEMVVAPLLLAKGDGVPCTVLAR